MNRRVSAFLRGMGSVLCLFPPLQMPIQIQPRWQGCQPRWRGWWRTTTTTYPEGTELSKRQHAWLVDFDGTQHYQDLALTPEGKPHDFVGIRDLDTRMSKSYRFQEEEEGYLIYRQVPLTQYECPDCGWRGTKRPVHVESPGEGCTHPHAVGSVGSSL